MMDLNPKTGNWLGIASAPRDGTPIWVMDPDAGAFVMRWDRMVTNPIFSKATGMWISSDGSMTWCEDTDAGPTWWKPATPSL